ncbi:MAG: ATP-binding cassette domain-containing protein [Cohaesibacteraceae bacterium]|nr:ATP-binding cassette domain-containing protein [Cohaesibacteraceae bacterium]
MTIDPRAEAIKSSSPLLHLLPYLGRYKGTIAFAIIALTLAAAVTLAVPAFVREFVDNGFADDSLASLNGTIMILLGLVGILSIASALRYYTVIWLGERIVSDLRSDVFTHLSNLSPAFFDEARTGELTSRLTADTTQIKSAVGATASVALRNLVLFFGASVMMVITSAKLSGLVLLVLPAIILPLVAFGRAVRRKQRKAQDTLADANAFATEALANMRVVQAFTNESFVSNLYNRSVNDAFGAAKASFSSRAFLTAFATFAIFAGVIAVLWFAALDVRQGLMSSGELSQFLLYSIFAAAALGALSEVWGELSQASGSAERLFEILHEPVAIRAPARPAELSLPVRGHVEFDQVKFHYPASKERRVLEDVSFSVKPGQQIALVGPSGAGKTTIFQLLLRFYDTHQGTIKLDGIDITRLDPGDLRRQLSLVPQDPVIFGTSILDNIRYGRPEASIDEIMEAANSALVDDFVSRLPDKYETMAGERGVKLSGGQKQRIAIARAILKNAPILLLDEATSALDAESEHLVQKALERLRRNRTSLTIAHRLATVKQADQILVFNDGKIVEQGSHDDLVTRSGLYARLATLQFSH